MKRRIKVVLISSFIVLILVVVGTFWWIKQLPIELVLSWRHDHYEVEEYSFYTFSYHPDDRRKIEMMQSITADLLELGEKWFGEFDFSKEELNIFLIHKDDLPHPGLDGDGVYVVDENIILIRSEADESELLNIYSHEFAHYMVNQLEEKQGLSRDKLPLWFQEGTASAFAQRLSPVPLSVLANHYKVENLMEIKNIETREVGIESAYLLMQFAIEYLIHHHDEQIVSEIIEETKKTEDFTRAFKNITNYDMSSFHHHFGEDWDYVHELEKMIELGNETEAEHRLLEYLNKKGDYFIEAPYIFYLLGDLYIKQERYEEALTILEKRLLYIDNPQIYKTLSEVASHFDKQKSLEYQEESVESAKRNDWSVQEYEKQGDGSAAY